MKEIKYNYTAYVAWSDNDECYVAHVPAFKHCMAHGDTAEEAIHEVYDGLGGIIDAMSAEGMELPNDDQMIQLLKRLKPMIKISHLAKQADMKASTLSSKIDRGGPFSQEERKRLHEAIELCA